MPLTSVVDYLNGRLSALHPRAHLRQRARYRIHRGSLTAEFAGFVLTPALMPVVAVATGTVFGQRAQPFVKTQDGQAATPESLYGAGIPPIILESWGNESSEKRYNLSLLS